MARSLILQLDNVTKRFSSGLPPAVDAVSLTLNQGDILVLLGPSGCGKTTLLRLIAGFERPEAGTVKLAGREVAGPQAWVPPEQRSIGMVFQDFALFPHLTIAQNVAFGLRSSGKKRAALVRERVADAIALVGLKGMEQRFPHELSGGQQQRVALARALAPQPTLVLLDEPLSNLDVQVRLYLRQEVRNILKATGTSAIFVTHDQEEALAIADQVAVMRQGQLEQLDAPEKVYTQPASRFVAEFVTQANFFPAERRGAVWQTEMGSFPAERLHCSCHRHQNSLDQHPCEIHECEVMIRQEDLTLEPDLASEIQVCDRQFLGREYSYSLLIPSGKRLQVRTPTTVAIPVGTKVRLALANPELQVFPARLAVGDR